MLENFDFNRNCMQATKKIADAKLAKDFQAVLKEFQKAQRLAAEKETTYAPFIPQAVLPSRYCDAVLSSIIWEYFFSQTLDVFNISPRNQIC